MLDLDITGEARALIQYAEVDGADPEPTAALWAEATASEALQVVRKVYALRPDVKGAEWYEDFLYAHRWLRRHGIKTVKAAQAAVEVQV